MRTVYLILMGVFEGIHKSFLMNTAENKQQHITIIERIRNFAWYRKTTQRPQNHRDYRPKLEK